ncbi:hypothetical protein [Bacillus sp. FJAT-52991]|uniref:Sensor histidine kinase n=1 Tax=Bacillus kandeliae TaxID=3129297 RepID=A0ABZ2NB16_9BACI
MSKTIKKIVINTILTITFLAMLIPIIIFAIVFVWSDYRGMDTIVFFEDSDYEIAKTYNEYAVFHRKENRSLFNNVTGYLHEDDYLYVVNKDQMMIIDLKKDTHNKKNIRYFR